MEEDMSAVLLAIFDNYSTAERVRTELFQDGFPTDRYELTACCEPGRASLQPGASEHDKFITYFRTVLPAAEDRHFAEEFAERLDGGAACITVHPRGPVETLRAREILALAGPTAIAQHDISSQALEHAAARAARPWISHFWVENHSNAHCIYCALFEKNLPDDA
jgi:hypothetical protein